MSRRLLREQETHLLITELTGDVLIESMHVLFGDVKFNGKVLISETSLQVHVKAGRQLV